MHVIQAQRRYTSIRAAVEAPPGRVCIRVPTTGGTRARLHPGPYDEVAPHREPGAGSQIGGYDAEGVEGLRIRTAPTSTSHRRLEANWRS